MSETVSFTVDQCKALYEVMDLLNGHVELFFDGDEPEVALKDDMGQAMFKLFLVADQARYLPGYTDEDVPYLEDRCKRLRAVAEELGVVDFWKREQDRLLS